MDPNFVNSLNSTPVDSVWQLSKFDTRPNGDIDKAIASVNNLFSSRLDFLCQIEPIKRHILPMVCNSKAYTYDIDLKETTV